MESQQLKRSEPSQTTCGATTKKRVKVTHPERELTAQIEHVMNHSLERTFLSKMVKGRSQSFYNDSSFINPKSVEQSGKQSHYKRDFIQTYQSQFMNEGLQEIHSNPKAVNAILFSGMSASTMSSAKWRSVNTKRRLVKEKPMCPELSSYPQEERRKLQKCIRVQDELINNRCKSLDKYLNTVVEAEKQLTKIYGEDMGNYGLVLNYAIESDNCDILQAAKDVSYIQQLRQPQIRIYGNRKVQRKQHRQYVDVDEVYQVRPNKIISSGLK